MIQHPIAPVYDEHSNILILGSFPSVKSREQGFFYGHPQNRFWRVLAAVYGNQVPQTVKEKKAFLLQNGVAVWDVIASCEIQGSADSSIKDVAGSMSTGKRRSSCIVNIRQNRPGSRRCAYRLPVLPMLHGEWRDL